MVLTPTSALMSLLPVKNEEQQTQQLEEPLRELVIKQDIISKTLDSLVVKYKPVQVETKSFHNSSFFQANNIDTVHIDVVKLLRLLFFVFDR